MKEHANAPQAGHVCPTCHHPVPPEIKRHKTMGVYVPLWKPGHCRTPDCPENPHGEWERRRAADSRYPRNAPELHGHH